MNRTARFGACAALLVLGLGGCGLVSSDVADFNLALPEKKFAVDASSWNVDTAAAGAYFNTTCSAMPNACGQAAAAVCKAASCAGVCGASTQKCALQLSVNAVQPIDLVTEKPELKSINDQPVIKVTIDSVKYAVLANTMTADVPELTVYVAPATVKSPADPAAKPIGKIPTIKAGQTVAASNLIFTATGKADLVAAMSTFKTPFNVLVGSTLEITTTQQVPMGKLDASVQITAHAGL